jgi:hypothetical protein
MKEQSRIDSPPNPRKSPRGTGAFPCAAFCWPLMRLTVPPLGQDKAAHAPVSPNLRPKKRPQLRSDLPWPRRLSPAMPEGVGTRAGRRVLIQAKQAESDRRLLKWSSARRAMWAGKCSNILAEERGFPADEVVALASRRSQGTEVSYGDKTLKVQSARRLRFLRHRYLPDVGRRQSFSKEWSPKIGAQGCVVIDNSSAGATTRTCR